MTDQLISFETAKLAYDKGYRNPGLPSGYGDNGEYGHMGYLKAPTQSLLQKWLREKHNLIVLIAINEYFGYVWKVINHREGGFKKTYEEILEQGLQEALKLVQ